MYFNDRKKIDNEKIDIIKKRSRIENYIRYLLLNSDYTEVKTPIINRYADIAPITQFIVQSPLESDELYLRIAPTEYLKKLIHYGFEHIFEFSTNFRNDSINNNHLFEFTSLEIMDKDKNVYDKMNQTESIIKNCIMFCMDNNFVDENSDFAKSVSEKWKRIRIVDLFKNEYQIDINDDLSIEKLRKLYYKLFNADSSQYSKSKIISDVIDYSIEKYDMPVFVGEFPWNMEGPAKKIDYSFEKERYELYYKKLEIANMSSTLVDPSMLMKWYNETLLNKNQLEGKKYDLDPELIDIFNSGMFNSSVVGIGIDRLIMLLLNIEDIRKVVCFENDKQKILVKK